VGLLSLVFPRCLLLSCCYFFSFCVFGSFLICSSDGRGFFFVLVLVQKSIVSGPSPTWQFSTVGPTPSLLRSFAISTAVLFLVGSSFLVVCLLLLSFEEGCIRPQLILPLCAF